MKLYIKQKVFSWKDKFYVKDENGNDRYYVEGEFFSLGKKLHIYDMNSNEIAFIHQKVLSFLPRFFVFIGGIQVAEIVKEFTFFRNKYRIEGLGWDVDGDFMDHDYEITHMGRPIVAISKEWFTWGDSYMLDIADNVDPVNALSVVLAIDCVIEMQRRSSASN
ncbi:MAG: LURP-one-related family protein [Clostridia bacterium]|nr:LURP-one-related family protein [Clostridia bacterium]